MPGDGAGSPAPPPDSENFGLENEKQIRYFSEKEGNEVARGEHQREKHRLAKSRFAAPNTSIYRYRFGFSKSCYLRSFVSGTRESLPFWRNGK